MSDEKVKEYVTYIEETCGEEKDVVAILKYDLKDEALKKLLDKGKLIKSIGDMVYEISFEDKVMRVYRTGKILMKNFKDKDEAKKFLNTVLNF
jgi:hypothetical protein